MKKMETVVEVKETALTGPKQFRLIYNSRNFHLIGLTREAADAIVKAFGAGSISGSGTGEYALYRVILPVDTVGVAAYAPDREELGYRGPAMILETADHTRGVVIIGIRTPVKWQPASTQQMRY